MRNSPPCSADCRQTRPLPARTERCCTSAFLSNADAGSRRHQACADCVDLSAVGNASNENLNQRIIWARRTFALSHTSTMSCWLDLCKPEAEREIAMKRDIG